MIPFVYVNIFILSHAIICHQSSKDMDIYSVFLKKGIQVYT